MEISINTNDIKNVSSLLKNKTDELISAIETAEKAVSPLRNFRNPRIQRDLSNWDEIKSTVRKNILILHDSIDEISRAAEANDTANN